MMACGPPPPDSWRLLDCVCVHTQPRHPPRRSPRIHALLALLGVLAASHGVLAQPNATTNSSMETTTTSVPPSTGGSQASASASAFVNDTAALLASSDLTALFYRHYNSGVIVAPLVVANSTQLPSEVTSRIKPYELQFDQLDGFLQRALLWDAGYIYIAPESSSSGSNATSRRLATSSSTKSLFLKVYTRDGVDMADIAPTRSEMESAGCALQLCTSEYGTTWRAVSCGSSSAILSVVHCAIDTQESDDAAVASNTTDGRARSLWTAWNAEDRSSADKDALDKADLAAPDLNVAEYRTTGEGESRSSGGSAGSAKLLTIHTVPFSEEPPIGQCPASRTDERGDLLPTLTIPCASYEAVAEATASSASRSLSEMNAAAGVSNQWKQPKTSELLSTWLESVAPKSVVTSPTPGSGAKPSGSTPSSSNNNNNGGALPGSGGSVNNRVDSDGGFNMLNLIPIIVGALAAVAIVFGFVLLRKRRSKSSREDARRGAGGGRDGCSPYANSSMFKTEDAYIDATSFLSPAAAVSGRGGDFTASGRSNQSHPQAVGDLDNEIHSSNNSAVSLETVRASSDRRRSAPKSLVMATLRRVISEPSSGRNPVSRPSLDTEHLKLLQTDPNLSASRLSYDKIVFERVISRSPRYEVWLSQYEGEEIAVKRLVQRANNDSLLALDNELSLAGAAAAMASDDRMANALEAFVAEIQITASLDHPNLARFVGVAWARLPADSLCLVTEYQSNGDLRTYMHKHREKLTWPRHKLKWAKGIADGLRYLHNQRPIVLHLELNSTHVLLSDRLKPKLIDFGERLSAEDWTQLRISGEESQLTQQLGFPYWAAPEVLRGDGHLMASDVYSFGMLLLELDTCKVPFQDAKNTSGGGKLKPFQMMNMVVSGRLKPVMADSCPVEIREIIERCTDAVPGQRPKMPEVVRMLELADYEMVV